MNQTLCCEDTAVAAGMNRPRLLSIDDEPSFTSLLKEYFEPRGYSIDITGKGSDGLSMFRKARHDVVLLDLKMLDIDGDVIMRDIHEYMPGARVIFITAYNDTGNIKRRLLKDGAFALLEKPVRSLKYLEDLILRATRRETRKETG